MNLRRCRTIPTEVIAGSAFPPGETGLLAVLRAYFDESGTTGGSRLMTVVGLVSTPERWKLLSRAWKRELKAHRIDEFKAADCAAGKGEFVDWSQRRRDEFRMTLAREIDRRVIFVSATGVVRKDFKEWVIDRSRKGSWARNAYMWCIRAGLETIAFSEHRKRHRIACVFDEGIAGQAHAFENFRSALKDSHELRGVYFGSLTAAPSREYPPLQAADLLAYELRHHAERRQGIPKKYASLSPAFHRLVIEGGVFDAQSWEEVQRDLIRLRAQRGDPPA